MKNEKIKKSKNGKIKKKKSTGGKIKIYRYKKCFPLISFMIQYYCCFHANSHNKYDIMHIKKILDKIWCKIYNKETRKKKYL